jgi:hypothetical protein
MWLLGLRIVGGILLSLGAGDVVSWMQGKGSAAKGMPLERVLLLAGAGVLAVEWYLQRHRGRR